MKDPFQTLGVERRYDLDLELLEKAHRELSRALHPDRYTQAGSSERRTALEKAANVNDAFRILRDPILRAEALFELAGVAVGEDREPKANPEFLMEVLEQREALADARARKDLVQVHAIGSTMKRRARDAEAKLTHGFAAAKLSTSAPGQVFDRAAAGDLEKLVPLLGELRFYRRFADEVSAIEEEEEDER